MADTRSWSFEEVTTTCPCCRERHEYNETPACSRLLGKMRAAIVARIEREAKEIPPLHIEDIGFFHLLPKTRN